ncbi:MAG: NAD(P)/FAD-dependent oxidoreductase [Candidatus Omnitrophica bacterium]|nr:NAD(P)/FAD-dependent oxidoreductase [Candidatus Omnitrophota bacterium]
METKIIAVVGAGPAGMMAAIKAGELDQNVILIEKNPQVGKKLLLSGKGRCNLTNACDLESFISKFSQGGQFLRNPFSKFFNLDLMKFFEKRGLKLKTERQLRVFPLSNRSGTVLEVLKKELIRTNVKIMFKTQMKDMLLQDNKIKGLILVNERVLPCDKLILATGGISYPFTGSTGEGLDIARRLGHRIIALRPGLVPLETRQQYPRLLKGLTLKNIRLKFSDGKRNIISEIGELLFTEFGISGPLVLTLSGKIVDWLKEGKNVYADIDLKPALSKEQLDARLLREFRLNPKKTIKNTLKNLLPSSLINVFLDIVEIDPGKSVSQITQGERESLVLLLKGLRLNIIKSRPIEEAMITQGGVSLKDINPRTMESRLIKGLYFAGEIIDVDADTGGFNLQAAFSTGYLAGESAALS